MLKTDKQHADDIRLKCLELALNEFSSGRYHLSLALQLSDIFEKYIKEIHLPNEPGDILMLDELEKEWKESLMTHYSPKPKEKEGLSESQ